jgi:hypothetical protein
MHRTANTSAAPASTRTDGNGGRRFVLLSAASVLRLVAFKLKGLQHRSSSLTPCAEIG